MLRKCKWCGKEQEMTGKREFCPGDHCKIAWKYAKRTGRTGKGESGKYPGAVPIDPSQIIRPQYLNAIAAGFWDKVAPTVIARGHLNVLSEDAFAELCDIFSRLQDINTMINMGLTYQCDACGKESHIHGNRSLLQVDDKWSANDNSETKTFKESAISDLKRKYSKQYLDYCKAFYLTPLSNRGNFGLPEEENGKESKKQGAERFF